MNPLLPFETCVPDAEARVASDGRLYLYGSFDLPGAGRYCSDRYHVLSTDDMVNFRDHGTSFTYQKQTLYAPDAIEKDGKTYLYFCTDRNNEGVAVSDSPAGPFTFLNMIDGADHDGIDPSVFIDDDGQGYLVWGQFRLRGAKLNSDMRSIDRESLTHDVLTEAAHGFHEGASLRKIGKLYYLVYTDVSRGSATCLSYATSPAPLGPYVKRGVIIDNVSCDPRSWNDHGSIQCFHGQWYVFYHRSSEASVTSRRVCCEKITVLPDGTIPEVRQTVGGAEGAIDARKELEAARFSRVTGPYYAALTADGPLLICPLSADRPEAWQPFAEYRTLDFHEKSSVCLLSLRGRGTVELWGPDGKVLGEAEVSSDEFVTVSLSLSAPLSGEQAVFLSSRGGKTEIKSFHFE